MTENSLDSRAIEIATEAKTLVTSHEQICAERYSNIIEKLGDSKTEVRGLYTRFWVVACSVISFLILILIILLKEGIKT